MRAKVWIGLIGMGSLAGAAAGHGEGDIGLLWNGSSIITAVANDEDGSFAHLGEFVFAADLTDVGGGLIGGDAPGFFTTDGPTNPVGAFDVGTVLSYQTMGALRAWNGSDFSAIAGPRLAQDAQGQTILTPLTDTVVDGFGWTYTGGAFDNHPDYALIDPEVGIFLWEIRFTATAASGAELDTTESVFVVFNNGLSELEHEAAIEWVETNLPAPGALALLGMGGALAARQRRA